MARSDHLLKSAVLIGRAETHSDAVRDALAMIASHVVWEPDVAVAASSAESAGADLVIVTEDVGPDDAVALVQRLQDRCPDLPAVVVSNSSSVDLAVRAVRAGAYDFIAGPLDADRVDRLVAGLRTERARRGADRSRFFCDDCPPGVDIVGQGQGLRRTLEMIRLVSESRCNPVLLLGETGTGKELAAQAVHAWRSGNPEKFLAVNCAALTASLLESELFGHVKGAFTGADREKTGLFEAAGTGTIFLDEISEMPRDLQAKLLRVLQEKTFRKVGGVKNIHCNATIIASSNLDLFAEADKGTFRKDLYYRLAVFPITLSPLRDPARRDDVPLLARYFLETANISDHTPADGISPDALRRLTEHDWPGNVRELRNVIQRALILASGEQVTTASVLLGQDVAPGAPAAAAAPGTDGNADRQTDRDDKDFSLETAEREFILRALKETGWQRTRAAALLGITRATLHAKLKRYDIQPPSANNSPQPNHSPQPADHPAP